MSIINNNNNNNKDAINNNIKPTKGPMGQWDLLVRSAKSALALCLLVSVSLAALAALSGPQTRPGPAQWISLVRPSESPSLSSSSCRPNLSDPDPGPTKLEHVAFALSGSARTWPERRAYSELWWVRNATRGFVWLDNPPKVDGNISGGSNNLLTGPPYRVSARFSQAKRASDRIARILKEAFEAERTSGVRWFVMGDDDTVFFADNLVTVLARYDHHRMYYIGGSSESVEQDVMHGYDTAFGGGGFAVSYPLACELVRILDGCIVRYRSFYGSDEKVAACVAELGVPLTREPGFHQIDVRDDPYGLLAAHPVAPLVSLHHLDYVRPLFPNQTQVASLQKLMQAYHIDSARILQQSICYDHRRKWSVSVSWGYTAQLYPSLIESRVLSTPLQTFRTWRSVKDGPFVFNTRPFSDDPCERPLIYYLAQVEEAGNGKTVTTYKRVAAAEAGKKCNKSAYNYAMSVETITVVSVTKMSPERWMKGPRRDCCEIASSWSLNSNMRVKISSCKAGESITI